MTSKTKKKMICERGHVFYKSSDCLSCPICHKLDKPKTGFLSLLSSPARSALLNQGIETLEQLSAYSEKQILKLHGIGPSTIPILRKALLEKGLTFLP